jgi:hypothetical protein
MKRTITSNEVSTFLRQPPRFVKKFTLIISSIVLLATFFLGCKKDNFEDEVSGLCPVVVVTDPADKAVNVAVDKLISITFNTNMDPATINNTTVMIKQGTTAIAGTIATTADPKTFTFKPTVALLPFTVYSGTVTAGAKDAFHTAMVSDFVWSFTTIINTFTLTVTSANGSVVKIPNQANYNAGTTVQLTATANAGYVFSSWSGDASGSANPLSVLMDANKNITANFVLIPAPAPSTILKTVALFGVFGGNAGITNQGLNTVINNGNIGTTAASTLITGFHDGTTGDVYTETPLNKGNVTGRVHTAPPAPGSAASFALATQGLIDANAAYISISPASKPGGTDPGAGQLGGLTLVPGVYKSAGATFNITTGNLTLDAQGNPNAEWFFQTAAGLTVGVAGPAGARSVIMINGGQAKNVYWYVGSAAVINAAGGGVMSGNIIATSGITFSTAGNAVQTVLNGRAISLVASVTMVNTTVNVP